MVQLKRTETRCSLCSLGCYLGLRQNVHGTIEPEYLREVPELRRGVCNRGNMTAELLGLPVRVDAARCCDRGTPHPVPLDEAIGVVAAAAKSAAGTTVLVDGNLPVEDVAAALALGAASGGKVTVSAYLPAEDETALQGLAASAVKLLTPEELAECDAVLIVGDAFATHPVISRPVHELRKKNARASLVVVDSLKGKTSIFATHPLIVKPEGESRVLAVIADKLGVKGLGTLKVKEEDAAAVAGVSTAALAGAAQALAAAKKLGVILRPEIGKAANWDQIALLCGQIAAAKAGGVTACLTYGNALGSYRLSAGAAAKPRKSGAVTIVLGTDVVSVLSRRLCTTMLDGVKTLVAAARVPTPTVGAADVVLPLALNFEAGGTTVTGSGEVITVDAVADAPGEAVSAGELVRRLAKALGISGVERKVDVKALEKMPAVDAKAVVKRGQPEMPAAAQGELTAVTRSDAVHFHTGGLTSHCEWPRYLAPNPVASIGADLAAARGISGGDRVKLTSSEGEATAVAEVVKDQRAGVVGLCSGFAEIRGLFTWDETGRTGPVAVRVEKDEK